MIVFIAFAAIWPFPKPLSEREVTLAESGFGCQTSEFKRIILHRGVRGDPARHGIESQGTRKAICGVCAQKPVRASRCYIAMHIRIGCVGDVDFGRI